MSTGVGIIAGVFLGFLLVTVVLTPAVMRFARMLGAVDRGGYRKVYEGAMPLLGGLGIAAPFVATSMVGAILGWFVILRWPWFVDRFPAYFDALMNLATNRFDLVALAIGGAGIVALGMVDDTRGLRPRWKLLGQLAIGLFICLTGHMITSLTVPFIGEVQFGPYAGGFLTVLWIAGMINAFNLVDGIDGLASGIAFIAALALLVLSLIQQDALVALTSAALAGSTLAFLFYNFHPARIFLGDTGSMFLGYALATLSLLGAQKAETAAILLAPLLALGLPVFETFVSIVRRYISGLPLFTGDNRHTHHRLLFKGFSQPATVLVLCGAEFVLAAAAVISVIMPDGSPLVWAPYALYCATLVAVIWLAEYGRSENWQEVLVRRRRNRGYQALARYAALRVNDDASPVDRTLLLELCRQELQLRELEVVFLDGTRWSAHAPDETEEETPPRERLRVKSAYEEDITIWYAYTRAPRDSRRHDTSHCLAAIFDGLRVPPVMPVAPRETGAVGVRFSAEGPDHAGSA